MVLIRKSCISVSTWVEQVDENRTAWEKDRVPRKLVTDLHHRCVVCTLPHGSCQHSREWVEMRNKQTILDNLPKDSVELIMDDISDVLPPASEDVYSRSGYKTPSTIQCPTLKWRIVCSHPSDKISGKQVDLSSPQTRVYHTMVQLHESESFTNDTTLLVVFGGICNACDDSVYLDKIIGVNSEGGNGDPASDSKTSSQSFSFPSDVSIFHVAHSKWFRPELKGHLPPGRYGHVAISLNRTTMWMFGGRLENADQDGDTYILSLRDMEWERIDRKDHKTPSPSARVWSAAAKVGNRVILFGGVDLVSGQLFNDVWTWDVVARRWIDQVVIGVPPLARYGHALLACRDKRVLILGGCCVSTVADKALPLSQNERHRRVCDAAEELSRAYHLEEAELTLGMFVNYANIGNIAPPANRHPKRFSKDLSQRRARLAAAVAAREKDVAKRAKALNDALLEDEALTYWARLHSRNPLGQVDATFLNTDSMAWEVKLTESRRQNERMVPSARMHFSAVMIEQSVIVWGGSHPTAERMLPVEDGVHIFDTSTCTWSRPPGYENPDGIQPLLEAARQKSCRAQRALFQAKQRAMSLGAPGGRTLQVQTRC